MAQNGDSSLQAGDTPSGKIHKRSYLGKFERTPNQITLAVILISGLIFSFVSMALILGFALFDAINVLESTQQISVEAAKLLRSALSTSFRYFVIAAAVISTTALVYGTRVSNRIFGPLIPLRRFITSLRAGDYSARLRLREGDEFRELMADLNGLAEDLETRSRR